MATATTSKMYKQMYHQGYHDIYKDPYKGAIMIKRCDCKHAYQDKKYGKGKRVHNYIGGNGGRRGEGIRCTVCGKETK
jgi:hypothetical protein